MVRFVDKHLIERANSAFLLTFVGGGVATCAIAAALVDISRWLAHW
jgi:hypothetical protein